MVLVESSKLPFLFCISFVWPLPWRWHRGGVRINYRFDGSLFNIRRLQAVAKVINDTVFDLQYVDAAALHSHTPDGLQRQLDAISSAYSRAGLVVNSKKSEVLYRPSDSSPLPTFYISGDQLGLTEQFTYLGSIITSTLWSHCGDSTSC